MSARTIAIRTSLVQIVLIDEDIDTASGAFSVTTNSMKMGEMAVTQAFLWLESQDYSRLCVLSDSLGMIRRLDALWFELLQNSPVCAFTFIFFLGYADVVCNERADSLAGAAITEDDQPMDHADIFIAPRDIERSENFESKLSTSLLRIRELAVNIGTAKRQKAYRTHTKSC